LGTGSVRQFDFKRFLAIAVCLALATTSMMGLLQVRPGEAQAGAPVQTEGRIIAKVAFDGLEIVDPIYAQSIVKIAAGATWNPEEIAAACARLAETRKFEGNPFAEAREEDGQLVLVFVVKERPFVSEVTFVGNEKFKVDELLKDIDLSAGSPISEFTIGQARQAIERKYKEAGYYHATVDFDPDVLRDERRVLFRISEGPRVKVRRITFEGNNSYTALELRSKIETNTYIWLFRTGAFDDETAQRDAATLKQYYVDRGFLNAQVGYRIELAENQSDLQLIFQIDEGLQHQIKNVKIEGANVFDAERIAAVMSQTQAGAVVDADKIKADRERMLSEYGQLGYIYAEVATSQVFDEEDGFVNMTIKLKEGEQYRFGRIEIRGNRQTKDKVVRRELRFFPEELYNTVEAKAAEQRLTETRLFSEATITPQGETPGVRDALVDVNEADTTTILFGVGVTSNSGLTGSISIEQRNFDIFDWPRSGSELFKGKSFKGAGQTLRLLIEPGTELNRGRIEFREPYLLDKDLGLGAGAYVFERGRDEYDEQRIGGYISLDKRIRDGIFKDWAVEGASRFEAIDIDDVEAFSAKDIEDVKGSSWLSSLKGTLVRDKTDSAWLPSKGNRFKISYEQAGVFGGDYSFGKAIADYTHYFTLKTDTFDRKHILAVGATGGQIFGDAPVFERFYGGGIGSVRGFEFRGISPRDGIRDDRIGGDFMFLTNAEYSFPLMGKVVRGVTFMDMGTVEPDFGINSWRASVGFGARIYIKYFGPIPLAFDFAFPIAKEDEDDTQVFNFSFGTTF
jgi:outer membrane protein assembly complex protein YaeT